jgi:hypothetical protein
MLSAPLRAGASAETFAVTDGDSLLLAPFVRCELSDRKPLEVTLRDAQLSPAGD